jgi:hypothetical protein
MMFMITLSFNIHIIASAEKVWNSLWNPENYRKWTAPFCEGSYYTASEFSVGSRIHFLTPKGDGMYSVLDQMEIGKFLAFRHLGNIQNFEEMPLDDETRQWTNAIERYELIPTETGIKLVVQADTFESYVEFMNKTFPLALNALKQLAEN